ncbi:MAG: 30S ribosomal protein S12 methylthiotransferase RimO [Oscillospiraceae bacterium]|jgi:ribosomal protein S12 methylthiotransferase|nr:30S ribosomal protein S12 methylthiotransferase RimO [Oscillospiraceae bacterium]
MQKVGMVSLGCSKNLVDAERMFFKIKQAGYTLCADPALADVVIVNTCGFIQSAKEEAIETVLEFAKLKDEGQIQKIILTGCLVERYREQTAQLFPEVDGFLSLGCDADIAWILDTVLQGKRVLKFDSEMQLPLTGERIVSTLPFFSYLKIAEGCSNVCSYCAIPSIRGPFRSVPMEDVLAEAQMLAHGGVTEINVIAQDTTRYGIDLYGEYKLPELLRKLCRIDGFKWIRVLYCYPDRITDELLDVIASEEKIVKYIDLPVQHCREGVLKAMNRPDNEESLRALIKKIRERIPDVTLRTTLITGFPNESGEDFVGLMRFVQDMEFDRLGCFAYSQEEGTPACDMEPQIDEDLRQKRAGLIMETQNLIAVNKNAQKLGMTLTAAVEGYDRYAQCYFGRTAADAPDIDGKVFFTSENKLRIGQYVDIKITDAVDYDLLGEVVNG